MVELCLIYFAVTIITMSYSRITNPGFRNSYLTFLSFTRASGIVFSFKEIVNFILIGGEDRILRNKDMYVTS